MLVGLCVEPSLEMAVGLLGVLKAGGAYVPLDPSYPMDRIAFMLKDARVTVLLTQARLAGDLPGRSCPTLFLDADWPAIARERVDNPVRQALPDNLAYVIYTSGATGRPKGVLVEHRGVCNLIDTQQRIFEVRSGERVLQWCRFGFDVSSRRARWKRR